MLHFAYYSNILSGKTFREHFLNCFKLCEWGVIPVLINTISGTGNVGKILHFTIIYNERGYYEKVTILDGLNRRHSGASWIMCQEG